MEVEGAALTAGARLFAGSSWDAAYHVWLDRVFRGGESNAVQRLLDGEFLTDRMGAALDDLSLETMP
jgi:hypothetical protein